MNGEVEQTLTQKALRLKELDRAIVKSVAESRTENLIDLLAEYVITKKNIKSILIDIPFSVTKINNFAAKSILQKINLNEELASDKTIRTFEKGREHITGKIVNLTAFSDGEIAELEEELLMSWFSPRTYVENLCEIGSLALGVSLPSNLRTYVQEARSCYAFENFNAVHALCRTILETCIRNIYVKRHPHTRNDNDVVHIDLWKVKKMIREVSGDGLKDRLNEMYDKLGKIIHGHKTVGKKEAKESFKDTLRVIHDLYAFNRL